MSHPFTLDSLSVPFVMDGALSAWPARHWTVDTLAGMLGNKTVTCRLMHRRRQNRGQPAWESEGMYVQCRLDQFSAWCHGNAKGDNPLASFSPDEFSGYIDYKYMQDVCSHRPDMLEEVKWSSLGLEGINGADSTLWVGSTAASTPCHYDTYGFNLVAQIQGRKRWVLFPPEESCHLYPTRIPYEESSVFSAVDLSAPDLKRFPRFRSVTPVVLTLEAGQVLYVPRHWWHYVVCLDTAVSINTWVNVDKDSESRLEEAVTRALVSSLIPFLAPTATPRVLEKWINPTEELVSLEINVRYLKMALSSVNSSVSENQHDHQQDRTPGDTNPVQQWCDDDAESATSTDTVKSRLVSDTSQTQRHANHSHACEGRDQQMFLSHSGTDNTLDNPNPQDSTRKYSTQTSQHVNKQNQCSYKTSRSVSHNTHTDNTSQLLDNQNQRSYTLHSPVSPRIDTDNISPLLDDRNQCSYKSNSPVSQDTLTDNTSPSFKNDTDIDNASQHLDNQGQCSYKSSRSVSQDTHTDNASPSFKNVTDIDNASQHLDNQDQCSYTSSRSVSLDTHTDNASPSLKNDAVNKTKSNHTHACEKGGCRADEKLMQVARTLHGTTVYMARSPFSLSEFLTKNIPLPLTTPSGPVSTSMTESCDFSLKRKHEQSVSGDDMYEPTSHKRKHEQSVSRDDVYEPVSHKRKHESRESGDDSLISIYRPTPCCLDNYLRLLSPLNDEEPGETSLLQGEGGQEKGSDGAQTVIQTCHSLENDHANTGAETDSQTPCPSLVKENAIGAETGSETSCGSLDVEEALLKSVLHPDVIRLVVSKLKEQV